MRESRDFRDHSQMTDVAGGAKQGIFADEAEIGFSPGLVRARMRIGWDWGVEERACEGEALGLHSVGEDSEVADPDESLGHDMAQPAIDEFRSGQSHGLSFATVLAVLVVKGHPAVLVSDDSLVADGDSMGVAAEIAKDLLGSGHGRLGVDDEILGRGATQEEASCVLGQGEETLREMVIEGFEELPSKDLRELPHGQEEAWPGGDPARLVQAQTASGDDAVDVWVIPEMLIPGVENGDEAGSRPKMLSAHLDHGLTDRFKQERKRSARVAPEERNEAVRDGEDLMEIGNGDQVFDLGLDPKRLIETLTLGTVTIATGVVERTFAPAVIASLQTPAQSAGAARHHVAGDPSLVVAQARNLSQVPFENVGQLRSRVARASCLAVSQGPTPASPRPSIGRAGSSSD